MTIKKIISLCLGIALCQFLSYCKENSEIEFLITNSEEKLTKQNLRETRESEDLSFEFAKLLQEKINENKETLNLIQNNTRKKIDGDYDFLVASLIEEKKQLENRSTEINLNNSLYKSLFIPNNDLYRSIKINSGYNLLESIAKNEPLLNIYMPEWGDLSKYDDFLIVILPKNANDKNSYKLSAYNKNGDLITLDSRKEPNIPYLVVGYNERFNISKNNGTRSSSILNTKYYSYNLKGNYIEYDNINLPKYENRASDSNRKRNILHRDRKEVITVARFLSKGAVEAVEGWAKGQPEVFCNVYYKELGSIVDFIIGYVSSITINMDNNHWYSGRKFWWSWSIKDNYGNWDIINWNKNALKTKMGYLFYEDDGSVKIELSNFEKKINVKIEDGDLIGSEWVHYSDNLGKTYRISNMFEFVIDQKVE